MNSRLLKRPFLVITILTIPVWAYLEFMTRYYGEESLRGGLAEIYEIAPLFAIIGLACLAGTIAPSLPSCIGYSISISLSIVLLSVSYACAFNVEYAHDIWVGDSGWAEFALIQGVLLSFLVAVPAVSVYLLRQLFHKLRRGG